MKCASSEGAARACSAAVSSSVFIGGPLCLQGRCLGSRSQNAASALPSTRQRKKHDCASDLAYTPIGYYVKPMHDRSPLINRLSRIEGQVRGVAKMIEEDR